MHSPVGAFTGLAATPEERERCIEAMVDMADYARPSGIRISVEPLNRFESYLMSTVKEAADIVTAVNRPNFGILFDTFHANIEAKDPVAAFENYHGLVNHFHVSENDRGIRAPATSRSLPISTRYCVPISISGYRSRPSAAPFRRSPGRHGSGGICSRAATSCCARRRHSSGATGRMLQSDWPPSTRRAGMTNAPVLEMVGITKTFPGVKALSDVSFDCRAGEVHAICGETAPASRRL